MPPALSVVVPHVNGSPWIDEVLNSLEQQTVVEQLEVLVPSRLAVTPEAACDSLYAHARWLPRPRGATIPQLRWHALQHARAKYAAFLEDHTPPPLDWAERMLALHGQGYDAVGGPVTNGSAATLFDRAFFLCEYAEAMPPLPGGVVQTLPGNNVSFRKSLLTGREDLAERWEDAWCEAIRDRQGKVHLDPGLAVPHRNPLTPSSYFAQRYYYGRAFAAMRARHALWPVRLLQGLGAIAVLPWLLPLRLVRTLVSKRSLTPANVAILPLIWPYQLAGAWGEALGAWFGDSGALARVR